MPHSTFDPPSQFRSDDEPGAGRLANQPACVALFSRSQVTLVVLRRIVERARMRAFVGEPEQAALLFDRVRPTVVILDGGAELRDCDAAVEPILMHKRLFDGLPHVILLTNSLLGASPHIGAIDAMVAKPVTPDRLQPMLEQVRDRHL